MFRKSVIAFLGLLAVMMPAVAEVPRVLSWESLVPPGPPIANPLDALTVDQQIEMGMLASIRARKAWGEISDVHPVAEYDIELTHKLKSEGVDVERLLVSYGKMQIEVMKRNAEVVEELDGQMIRVPGYALPLEFDGTAVEEFLLVPYVGACIHVPAPPINQMVLVRANQSYAADTLYEPIWITGRMKVERKSTSLFLIDGSAKVDSGYTVDTIRVEPYTE